jgi:hypothetical protein
MPERRPRILNLATLCEKAKTGVPVGSFVEAFDSPDRKANGTPPMPWWFYNRFDGVCVVPVDGETID